MARNLRYFTILVCITTVFTKSPTPELPPCPTTFQFLPQNLPMHCKMPGMPPPFPPLFPGFKPVDPKSNDTNKMPMPIGMPPMPPMPIGMPGMPMGMPPGMPMPMPIGGPPSAKLPVIVMPFYSPEPRENKGFRPSRKPSKRRKIRIIKKSDSDTDTDTDTSSSTDTDTSSSSSSESDRYEGWWKNRRAMRRRKKIRHTSKKPNYLTPVLQYVNNDGYVIFEKEISKGEAKDWLSDNDPGENGIDQNELPTTKKPLTDYQKVATFKKRPRRIKPNLLMPYADPKLPKRKER